MGWELKFNELQKGYTKQVNQLMIDLYNTDIKRLWRMLKEGGYNPHNQFEMCDSKFKAWIMGNGFILKDENRKYIVRPFGFSEGFELRELLHGEKKPNILYKLEFYRDYPASDFELQINNRKEILVNPEQLFDFLLKVGSYICGLEEANKIEE